MPTKYLFTLLYFQAVDGKRVETEEHIVAETWQQAQEYWAIELQKLGNDVQFIKKQVPVVAICPQDKRL